MTDLKPPPSSLPRRKLNIAQSALSEPVIRKPEGSKALFVSSFTPEVNADGVSQTLKKQLSLKMLVYTKFRTKRNSYSSFHIPVTEDEFSLINNTAVWPR
jgi:hypothetical protein